MNVKLLKNDFKKNPWNNFILFLFMSLSVTIAVSVVFMLSQLFTSISTMYETAKPPHFLQMHKGELNQKDIDAFNRNYPGVKHWQTVCMLDVYGEELYVSGEEGKKFTLADCKLDISLVKQNEKYDVLLDEKRNKLKIKEGEIGVPVILLEQYDISIGDKICLKSNGIEKTFVVSEYVYDGQMNSTLCSSTRFLISDEDFAELFGKAGEKEYIIETYFTDRSMTNAYQTAYEQSEKNLPKDGQAVTYPIIFLLSAMTDIMTAMVFLLTGVLLIVIALICLRYTILEELEEDKNEIGTMKAMGIPGKGIRELYLGKIRILMVAGCICGFLAALFFVSLLTGHMNRTFGKQQAGAGSYLFALGVWGAVYGVILAFSRKVLGKVRKAGVVDLLVREKGFGKVPVVKDGIHKARNMPLNLLIGFHEVRRGYGIIFSLLLIISCSTMIPYRMVHTMKDKEFSTYMGSPVCDVVLEVEQGAGIEDRKEAARQLLLSEQKQKQILGFETLRNVRLQALGADGEMAGIYIDTGKCAGKGLKYLAGGEPGKTSEIALSVLMAEELGKEEGDTVTLVSKGKQKDFFICGIYQDVTSGGKTAKMVCDFPEETAVKYAFQITMPKTERKQNLQEKIESWSKQLGNGYSIQDMENFLSQTLGSVSVQLEQAVFVAFLIGLCLTVLISLLYLKLRIARETGALAVKRAIGIPFVAICRQELYPVLIAGGSGALLGVFLAGMFGDDAVSVLFRMMGMGLKQIQFAKMPVWQQLILPVLLLGILTIVTRIVCKQIKNIDLASHFNE